MTVVPDNCGSAHPSQDVERMEGPRVDPTEL